MENVDLTKIVTEQAIAFITKSSPFGHIPLVNSTINKIVANTISIVLSKTILSSYIKQIEDDVQKQAAKATDAREQLKNNNLTKEERAKHEEDLKDAMRSLLSFKP